MTQEAVRHATLSAPAVTAPQTEPRTLIDELLAEQKQLNAVERFAQAHDRGEVTQSQYYRDLIPLQRPEAGQQYAFAVDLDACTGCKACVSACHSLNGLDDDEVWRNVGVLHGGDTKSPYQQTVTTACHHCLEPACMDGCPVMAYDKDPVTGIVMHLDDQCIGCQYCILKCPYDVPKYSAKRGIVRKCDMCSSRLAVGEAPACVQACPTQAIRIETISTERFERDLRPAEVLVPGAFASEYTLPTTRYLTQKPQPANAIAGDAHALRLEHAHWPLILMLILTQMSVGTLFAMALLASHTSAAISAILGVASFVVLQAGLAASVLHLGRPLGAWRFFLGLRTSWMSREILVFGLLAAANAGVACTALAGYGGSRWDLPILSWFGNATTTFACLSALLGLAAIYCSAMIYIDTRRTFWKAALTLPNFFGTTVLLGFTLAACLLGWSAVWLDGSVAPAARNCAIAAAVIRTVLFAWEASGFFTSLRDVTNANHCSARIIWELCRPLAFARFLFFAASTLCGLFAITHSGTAAALAATVAFATTTASQIIERYFFFSAVIAPRMPGHFTA